MRFVASFFFILGIATLFGVANGYRCGISIFECPKDPMVLQLPSGVDAIAIADAREAYDLGSYFFIDTRSGVRFGADHVEGASSLPREQFVEAFQAMDPPMTPDMPLILYGEDGKDSSVTQVAEELLRLGFQDVKILVEGWQGWNNHKIK